MEPATRVTPSEKGAASCAVMSVDRTNRSSVNGLAKPTTLLRRLATLLLLPPEISSPQETTEPSLRRAAKAETVEKIWETVRSPASPLKSTEMLSPPEAGSPQVTTEPSLRRAAKAPKLPNSCPVVPGNATCIFPATTVLFEIAMARSLDQFLMGVWSDELAILMFGSTASFFIHSPSLCERQHRPSSRSATLRQACA